MKVKIINQPYWPTDLLEDSINDFIKDKKTIDIKYQSDNQSALIVYEDKKETADKPVVEKIKEEKVDLDEKIRKTFLNDDEKLSNVGKEQVNLLRCQLETMEKYSDILWARINDLEG